MEPRSTSRERQANFKLSLEASFVSCSPAKRSLGKVLRTSSALLKALAVAASKSVLVTSATRFIGRRVVPAVLKWRNHCHVGMFSRDELKQSEMQSEFTDERLVVGLLTARFRAEPPFEVS